MNIVVLYSCHHCGLAKIEVSVQARENEDVIEWMETLGRHLSADHAKRSPHCHPERLSDVMIPMAGADRVGGPAVN